VIAYFDTSAVIPTIIDEPASVACVRLWDEADRVISVRLLYPEARAAVARAHRMNGLTLRQLTAATGELDAAVREIDIVEIGAELARNAGELAQRHGLRGYDAVHLAAAVAARSAELVVVTGDTDLARAAHELGLHVAHTS
jgi:predicted nucleic acid-binding protein